MQPVNYLCAYPVELQQQIQQLIAQQQLGKWLRAKYPHQHQLTNDQALRNYTLEIKNRFIRKSAPLSKVVFDPKIHVLKHALGLHSYVSRIQGNKLKSKNEIRISSLFKQGPEAFLQMIVVHELAHLKEKQHNKAFYQLCQHMLPHYHQLEFDTRVYLTHLEQIGPVYD